MKSLVLLVFVFVFVLLTTTSMVEKSATFDGPNKLISGYANIKWRDTQTERHTP